MLIDGFPAAISDPTSAEHDEFIADLLQSASRDQGIVGAASALCAFSLGVSLSGTQVVVQAEDHTCSSVLLCGWGGSSVQMLEPMSAHYAQTYPGMRVISTVGINNSLHGLLEVHDKALMGDAASAVALLESQQIEEVAQELARTSSHIVHLFSNQGFYFYQKIYQRHPELKPQLKCIIMDSAPDCFVGKPLQAATLKVP